MVSEHTSSSLSAYTALIAAVIGLFALILTERGWHLLNTTSRGARKTIWPSEGQCESRLWENLPSGPLHVCTPIWSSQCHMFPHAKAARCWDKSLGVIFNQPTPSAPMHITDKPRMLPLSREFLHIDLKVLVAFIFMSVEKGNSPPGEFYQTNHRTFKLGDRTILDLQSLGTELTLLHIEGTLQRVLAKDYVDRLFSGFPPLLQDPRNKSVFRPGDEKRGGWVVALGLQGRSIDDPFLPVYLDCAQYNDRRGRVFWRSMDRIRKILVNVWAKAFASNPTAMTDIAAAIEALEYICDTETESGVNRIFGLSMPNRTLSNREVLKIITHFNGSPLIATGDEQQFRSDWEGLLPYVLVAAVHGSITCIGYFKNPGRELEVILPIEKLRKTEIYLRGC